MVCLCYDIPNIERIGNDITRNLIVTPYNLKFCDNPQPNTNERQINTQLKEELESVQVYPQFMLLLIGRVIDKYNVDIQIPKQVSQVTAQYFEENNVVKRFVDDTFDKVNDKNEHGKWNMVSLTRAYQLFEEYISGERAMSKKVFNQNMSSNNYEYLTKKTDGKLIRGFVGLQEKSVASYNDGSSTLSLRYQRYHLKSYY